MKRSTRLRAAAPGPLLVTEPGTPSARELWDSLVVASGDKDVLAACAELGLASALAGQ
jgi:hypothetical protein